LVTDPGTVIVRIAHRRGSEVDEVEAIAEGAVAEEGATAEAETPAADAPGEGEAAAEGESE
jgi:hypothetical protein